MTNNTDSFAFAGDPVVLRFHVKVSRDSDDAWRILTVRFRHNGTGSHRSEPVRVDTWSQAVTATVDDAGTSGPRPAWWTRLDEESTPVRSAIQGFDVAVPASDVQRDGDGIIVTNWVAPLLKAMHTALQDGPGYLVTSPGVDDPLAPMGDSGPAPGLRWYPALCGIAILTPVTGQDTNVSLRWTPGGPADDTSR